MNTSLYVYLQHFFIPSYLTVLYAFLSGAAYGIIGSKLGFAATTVLYVIGAVAYASGMFK
jgi:uncharacterized membrane protein HdeD (DUF308 family)